MENLRSYSIIQRLGLLSQQTLRHLKSFVGLSLSINSKRPAFVNKYYQIHVIHMNILIYSQVIGVTAVKLTLRKPRQRISGIITGKKLQLFQLPRDMVYSLDHIASSKIFCT